MTDIDVANRLLALLRTHTVSHEVCIVDNSAGNRVDVAVNGRFNVRDMARAIMAGSKDWPTPV